MMANSTGKAAKRKHYVPPKPYKNFPLTPHPGGKWMKKIKGKLYYFGRWGSINKGKMKRLPDDGWQDAHAKYKAQAADLEAGRKPREVSQGALTLLELCNRFLTAKQRKVDSNELSPRTVVEYRYTTDRLINTFGKDRLVEDLDADDFAQLRVNIAKHCGPVRLSNEITRTRSVFKYAYDNSLITQAVKYGSEFAKPRKAVLRKHKASSDKKLFEPAEIRSLLQVARPQMKAAILLGINCGAGNTDVANLECQHLDLDSGWLDYPRGKTGIGRVVPLWPETVKALADCIATRCPKTEVDRDIAILSDQGRRLVRITEKSRSDEVTVGFGKLLKSLEINNRKGLGFYALRHTFATIGLQLGDRDTVKALMGHVERDVLAAYDETGPSPERRLAIVKHVHEWLFAGEGGAAWASN